MVDYDHTSRFQVSQVPPAAPGTCCACSTPNGPFISLGRTVKFVGLLVLCKGCAQHIAEQFGLFVQEETDLLVATTTGFSDGFEAGKDFTTRELRNYLDNLGSPAPPDSTAGASTGVEDVDRVPEDSANSSGDVKSPTGSGKSGNESARKRGRTDVPLTSVELGI